MWMRNPWLDIPAADYVGHMSSPEVGQHRVLNRILGDTLASTRPRSVLVLGCSTGNGLEHVDSAVTARVVGIDINPSYLQELVARFAHPAFMLDVQRADLAECTFEPEAFDLVHAALVFEYMEWTSLLRRVVETLRPRGMLSVVLQRPSPTTPAVTRTGFARLRSLEPIFRFVQPDLLASEATALGLHLELRRTQPLASGKELEILRFRKGA
jgi:SAM-dependent methyltransferase